MLAAFYEKTGPAADVLRVDEMPTPEPGAGEVRVRIAWSGVNPSDVKARAGVRSTTLPFPRMTPHSDGAGVIDAVGSGVDQARVGESVWVYNGAWGRPNGTAAQYCVLPEEQAVPLPAGVGGDVGACMGIPALTAYHAVHCNGGVAGQRVLVTGGAGAVSQYAIQMAILAGARQVLATASTPEKQAVARDLGAQTVIDYRRADAAEQLLAATGGEGVDRVIEIEFSTNAELDLAALRTGGLIVVYGSDRAEMPVPFYPAILKHALIQFFIVYTLPADARQVAVKGVTDLLKSGSLRHPIAHRLPLSRIAEAHDLVELRRVVGNVVLEVS